MKYTEVFRSRNRTEICVGVTEFVEERVRHRVPEADPRVGDVFEQLGAEIAGVRRCVRPEHLLPRVGPDLRELEVCVVRVHLVDLFPGRGAEHLHIWGNPPENDRD